MAVDVTLRVHDGSSWTAITNHDRISLKRKLGAGEASFRVPNATVAQRDLVRVGRECEVVVTTKGETKSFGGYIDKPRFVVEAPKKFNIHARVVDLSHGATWILVLNTVAVAPITYSDIIDGLFANSWLEVDRSGITSNPASASEDYRIGAETLARATDKIVKEYLPDWVWWVAHNGTDANGVVKKLFVQERGANDLTGSVTITQDDIPPNFTVRSVVDPRSNILVIGDDDPEEDADWPLSALAVNVASAVAYGTRELLLRESEAKTLNEVGDIAAAVIEQRKFDLWETRLQIDDHWNLEPGDKILLYLPDLGIDDGAGGGVAWVLQEVEETVRRGRATRFGVFRETQAAAGARV